MLTIYKYNNNEVAFIFITYDYILYDVCIWIY